MKDLLYAALSTAGFAPDRLSSFVADNRSDGGVDAYLDGVPLRPSTLLPGPMVFQFKRSCPSESKLIAELNAPAQERARRLLEAGADYALLVGADVRPESIGLALTRRIGALVAGWRGQARVFGARQLLQLLLENAGTWRRYVPAAGGTLTWKEWAELPRFALRDFKWTPGDARRRLQEAFAHEVAAGHRQWRYVGPPGVGKSRFVLEATRGFAEQVLVSSEFSSHLRSLEVLRIGWLIVDECTNEQHEELVGRFGNSKVRLITIGRDEGHSRTTANRIPPMDVGDAIDLVPGDLPLDVRHLVAESSGGYPKLLRLYADSARRNPQHVPTRTSELNDALRAFLDAQFGAPTALELWALPTIGSAEDLELLAKNGDFGVPVVQVGKAREYLNDHGLLGTVGEPPDQHHYVTPLLFAQWLASELWKAPRAIIAALKDAPVRLRQACILRLARGDETLRSRLVELDTEWLLGAATPDQLREVGEALAALDPERGLHFARRLLHGAPSAQLANAACWTLRTVAWFPATFVDAAELLSRYVDGSSTYMLFDLFGTHLGTTRAGGELRIEALDRVAQAAPHLALRAAMEACGVEAARGSGGLPDSLEAAWRPASRDEELHYTSGAANVLARLIVPERVPEVLRAVRPLFRRALGEAVAPIVDAFVEARLPTARLVEELDLVAQHDLAHLRAWRPRQEALLREYLARLPSPTLPDRLARLVGSQEWFERTADDPPTEAETLARQFVESADAVQALAVLSERPAGPGQYEFARLCSRIDVNRRLVPLLVELARGSANFQFSVGYFAEWPRESIDRALLQWAADPALVPLVFALAHRLGGSNERAALLLSLVERGALPAVRLGDLYFGAWLRGVSEQMALALLERTPVPTRFLMAVQRFEIGTTARAYAVEQWFQVGAAQLSGMVEHDWQEVAREARAAAPERFRGSVLQRLLEAAELIGWAQPIVAVISDWLREEPAAIASILAAVANAPRLLSALRELHLTQEAQAAAVDWAVQHRDHAAVVAALSSGVDDLALALLEKAGTDPRVRSALAARAGSYHGWGSFSTLTRARSEEIARLASRAKAPHARKWFSAQLAALERTALQAEQQEAAEKAGAVPLPSVADL